MRKYPKKNGVFWGPYTPTTPPKTISTYSGGCRLSIWHVRVGRNASCGALGGHFCRRRPWSAMVVLVVVCRWRLTSDWPTVGIIKIVYRSIFLFLRRNHTFLTSDLAAKKGRLRPSHLLFSGVGSHLRLWDETLRWDHLRSISSCTPPAQESQDQYVLSRSYVGRVPKNLKRDVHPRRHSPKTEEEDYN